MAQAALDARDYGRAREALKPLLADRPTVRSSLMMAAIEEAEHGAASGQAREWLARAARAPRDPVWIADGIASDTWAPVSPVTGRLDAFVWREPPNTLAAAAPAMEPEEPEETQPVLVPAHPAPTPAAPLPTIMPASKTAPAPAADPVSAGMAAAAVPAAGEHPVRRAG